MHRPKDLSPPLAPLTCEDLQKELVQTVLTPLAASLADSKEQLLERLERLDKTAVACKDAETTDPPSSRQLLFHRTSSTLAGVPSAVHGAGNAAFRVGLGVKDLAFSGFGMLFRTSKGRPDPGTEVRNNQKGYELLAQADAIESIQRSEELVATEQEDRPGRAHSQRTLPRQRSPLSDTYQTLDDEESMSAHLTALSNTSPTSISTHRLKPLGRISITSKDDQANARFRIVRAWWFDYLTGLAILVSSASIGLQVDHMARRWTDIIPDGFVILDTILCASFCLETFLRIAFHGGYYFFSRCSHLFDFAWICCFVLETSIHWVCPRWSLLAFNQSSSLFPFIRVLRLPRIVRFFKLKDMSPEFNRIWFSLVEAMRSLFGFFFLLVIMLYISGVCLLRFVTNAKLENSDGGNEQEELEIHFGTLGRTMLSLYQVMSEGIHWTELVAPLTKISSPWLVDMWFSIYMAFITFAFLNVVTAHICEQAAEIGKQRTTQRLMRGMKKMFGSSRSFTLEELAEKLETPQMRECLDAIELTHEDALLLFNLLQQRENCEEIGVNDFVHGCTRINGPAKATDIVQLTRQLHSWVSETNATLRYVSERMHSNGQGYETKRALKVTADQA